MNKKLQIQIPELKKVIGNLKKGDAVIVSDFGTFSVSRIKSRTLFHNTGKREIKTKPYNRIKFTAVDDVRDLMNK